MGILQYFNNKTRLNSALYVILSSWRGRSGLRFLVLGGERMGLCQWGSFGLPWGWGRKTLRFLLLLPLPPMPLLLLLLPSLT